VTALLHFYVRVIGLNQSGIGLTGLNQFGIGVTRLNKSDIAVAGLKLVWYCDCTITLPCLCDWT
jgi:hypothetical protein